MALAFTRSPTLLAYAAWDIAKLSGGRFQLGLGTQIRQNIEDRYGVPFGDDPIGRLRDYVGAVRAAFASFVSGEAPSYESEHYRVTRLQPYFNPGPDPDTAVPPVYLGGVQRRACALAGEVADGFVSHPTNSNPRYLTETCLPALAEGARTAGRDLEADGFETVVGTSVITGRDAPRRSTASASGSAACWPSSTPPPPTPRRWSSTAGTTSGRACASSSGGNVGTTWAPSSPTRCSTRWCPRAASTSWPEVLVQRFAGLGQGITVSAPTDEADDEEFAGVVAALQAA